MWADCLVWESEGWLQKYGKAEDKEAAPEGTATAQTNGEEEEES